MSIESLVAQLRDATASTPRRGAALYVSAPLYALLSTGQRLWLWERAQGSGKVRIAGGGADFFEGEEAGVIGEGDCLFDFAVVEQSLKFRMSHNRSQSGITGDNLPAGIVSKAYQQLTKAHFFT